MSKYLLEDIPADELAQRSAVAVRLADSVRELIESTVVTEVGDESVADAIRHIEKAREILAAERLPGAFGIRFNSDGTKRNWGNAVVGLRNPVAPPIEIGYEDGLTWGEAELGPAYEGPAGLVHGGIIAAILDQVLGSAAENAGAPGMTGTLTMRYRRGTRLGPIRAEARLDRVEGPKSFVTGTLSTDEGVCVEAEGIFILPKWARGDVADKLRKAVGEA